MIRIKMQPKEKPAIYYGDFSSIEAAKEISRSLKTRVSDVFVTVEHELTDLESVLLGVPPHTVIKYSG